MYGLLLNVIATELMTLAKEERFIGATVDGEKTMEKERMTVKTQQNQALRLRFSFGNQLAAKPLTSNQRFQCGGTH